MPSVSKSLGYTLERKGIVVETQKEGRKGVGPVRVGATACTGQEWRETNLGVVGQLERENERIRDT